MFLYGCVYWYTHIRAWGVRAPNHLLLSAHCKDLIKICKSMTIITIVYGWINIYQFNVYFHEPYNPLDKYTHSHTSSHTHIHTYTLSHLFQSISLTFALDCCVHFLLKKKIPNSMECHSFIVLFFVTIQQNPVQTSYSKERLST